jgi:non-heme Fe2+,alpha-ketoglutarate-dependent halogenase
MNSHPLKALYKKDGIVFPLAALSNVEIEEAQQQYLSLCSPGKLVLENEQRVFGHLVYPWVAKLVSHSRILEKVSLLIGPNILVWVSEFNAKAPNSPHYFSWHQDLFYWRHQYQDDLRNIPMVTVWLSLFDTHIENGCMRVIAGSHTHLLAHNEIPSHYNMLTRCQEIQKPVEIENSIAVELKAGEFSIHHPLLHHASGPNLSSQHRVGLVIRYLSPKVAPPNRPAYAWLVSGEDSSAFWDHVAPINFPSEHEAQDLRYKSMHSVQSSTGSSFK